MTSHPDRLSLALSDLHVVGDIAWTLLGGDESIIRVIDDRQFHDPCIPRVLETGMVVTYTRLFTRADGFGPDGRIPKEWIPQEHEDLHRFLVDRRHKHEAHTDGTAPLTHRRQVALEDDLRFIRIDHPERLTPDQLRELVELTHKLRKKVSTEWDAARPVPTPGANLE